MNKVTAERARRAIVEHTLRLAESAVAAGPDAVVPTAPEWTVAELVEHVGQTQHWVADIIERRITDPAQLPTEVAKAPTDSGVWQAWLSESAQRVVDACSDQAIDAPVFNAAGDERTGTQFWLTSMLNESVVHGFDAANTAATVNATTRPTGAGIAPDIAAELIGNHLAMLTSPTWAARRPQSTEALRGTGQTLQWQATDTTDAWYAVRGPEGATWHRGTHPSGVTVTGPAGSLLLVMTRRLSLEGTGIDISGDLSLAQHWIDNTAHVAG
ncbi:maleylpyruvate isomerase N-terminal domain-containing protein [Kribbella sp. NPDC051587]|uniref:maleylpyruvate isomerase N-terminal domain-containing protein n=1 Tax=Kribbella sp. NPDC051587 TaxID=3364119 RepID=UPI0037A5678F